MAEAVSHLSAGQHRIFHPNPGIVLHLLHGSTHYHAFLLEVAAETTYDSPPHNGEELRYVTSGEVEFVVGGESYRVAAGGTLRHPSTVTHSFRTGKQPATFVTFALARGFDVAKLLAGSAAETNGADPR